MGHASSEEGVATAAQIDDLVQGIRNWTRPFGLMNLTGPQLRTLD